MPDLEWQRAWALFGFLLPAILWWLARRPRPPRDVPTGTLSIWRELQAEGRPSGGARARGTPAWLVWTLFALGLGVLGLAGPRVASAAAPRWTVVVDTRAGMHLPWTAPDGDASRGTRLEVALERAREVVGDSARWLRFAGDAWQSAEGAAPPPGWSDASAATTAEPPWSEVDVPGTVFVTDRSVDARVATLVTSGGGAVPGVVGRRAGRLVVWDGADLVAGAAEVDASVALAPEVPREFAALTRAWARERGFAVRAGSGSVLEVRATDEGEGELRVGGAGWEVVARAGAAPDGRARWRDARGRVALAARPGVLTLGLRDPLRLEGDRDAAGLAWLDELEAAARPPADAVPLEARRAAGDPSTRRGPGPAVASDAPPDRVVVLLLVAALACGLLGLRARALRV